jgi:sigma-E factor negative regulatory protein RseA
METDMSFDSERDAAALERLSSLVDGELDDDAAARACGDWRESGAARSSWHAYHVIGDVLRSDDLACDAARDAGFLVALRARLKDEPVVLAPHPLGSSASAAAALARAAHGARRNRSSWMASSAVAAAFVALAGVVVLTRGLAPSIGGPAGQSLAQIVPAAQPMTASMLTAPMAVASEPRALVASGAVIRDARLDRYLAAHKQFAGSSALGVPSGFLRNATAIETER